MGSETGEGNGDAYCIQHREPAMIILEAEHPDETGSAVVNRSPDVST